MPNELGNALGRGLRETRVVNAKVANLLASGSNDGRVADLAVFFGALFAIGCAVVAALGIFGVI